MIYNIILALIFIFCLYFISSFIFDFLLRGFSPFLPSRPWVVQQILSELEELKSNSKMIAFSSGRSGFFHAIEKKYPKAELIAIEVHLFSFIVSKIQSIIRMTKIKIIRQKIHRVNVSEVDFIYSHLYPEDMDGFGKKLKFECKPGTIIVSTGFNIPYLEPKKIINLPDRKGRLDWLSKNQKLFQRKNKKYKKELKAFFYEI